MSIMRKLSSVSLLMCALVCLFFYQVHASFDIFINYGQPLRSVSNQLPFICVTMDWWPDNKCDSPDGQSDCAWIGSSVLNARIAPSSRLAAALAALGNVTLRIGGTLADSITYAAGADVDISCPGFTPPATAEKSKTFTGGCLREARWREVLDFCDDATGCKLVMGLNGMRGRSCKRHFDQSHAVCFDAYETCDDDWDSSNAEALVNATAKWGYAIGGYELGNELDCLRPEQYERSLRELHSIVRSAAAAAGLPLPLLIATDSYAYSAPFLRQLLPRVQDILSAVTWHDYPLHAGVQCSGPAAENNSEVDEIIMSSGGMDQFFLMAEEIVSLRDQSVAASEGALPEVWMGETGGAFNSGCNGSTNAFMSAFWYANALGGFAQRGHDMFCRQTLTGGNYELINKVTNDPNPDFYAALLFGRLMGSTVLAPVNSREARDEGLAVYAHCLPLNAHTEELYALGAVTVLFLNYNAAERRIAAVNGVAPVPRHEFILTGVPKPPPFQAKDALHSDVVALNEVPLRAGAIFDTQQQLLQPRSVYDLADREVVLPPYSYGFIVLPAAASAACS